jgi:hypothetical protein
MALVTRFGEILRREGLGGIPRRGAMRAFRSLSRLTGRWATRLERSMEAYRPSELEGVARNAALRNRHAGRRGFVLGNGPSIGRQDLSLLAGEITFAMNGFWKHPIVEQWQPTYYCLADPVYFDRSSAMRVFLQDLQARVHTTTFLVPLFARDVIQQENLLPHDRTYFIPLQGAFGDEGDRIPEFARAVPHVQSVSQLAIMAAMYTGCTPVYLLGLDHDWLAQRGPDRHFYDGKTVENHAVAHGDLDRYSYASDLESVLRLFKGYEHIQHCAAAVGVPVVNATLGGFLDVFPRAVYESCFPVKGAQRE